MRINELMNEEEFDINEGILSDMFPSLAFKFDSLRKDYQRAFKVYMDLVNQGDTEALNKAAKIHGIQPNELMKQLKKIGLFKAPIDVAWGDEDEELSKNIEADRLRRKMAG